MVLCAVCKEREATQKHHLNYNPEITIDVCVSCHIEIHQHGVGRERRELKPKPEEHELILPMFTIKKKVTGIPYITSKKGELLNELVCPNCKGKDFGTWQVFSDKEGRCFLRCSMCGVDYKIMIFPRLEMLQVST